MMATSVGSKRVSVNVKLTLLFCVFASLFLAGVFVWRMVERNAADLKIDNAERLREKNVDVYSNFISAALEDSTRRAAFDSELDRLVKSDSIFKNSGQDRARDFLRETYEQGYSIWIYNLKGQRLFFWGKSDVVKAFQPSENTLKSMLMTSSIATPSKFHIRAKDGVICEVRGAVISSSQVSSKATTKAKSTGILFVAKSWDREYQNYIGQLTNSKVKIEVAKSDKVNLDADVVLSGPEGKAFATLSFEDPGELRQALNQATDRAVYIFILFVVCLVTTLMIAVFRWVVQPLRTIGQTLAYGDLVALSDVERAGAEFEQVAGVIAQFFLQRDALNKAKENLELRVAERTHELREAYEATIEGWSRALEFRDQETEGHCRRVTAMTVRLASDMGISGDELLNLKRGALLHDIGKMGIPDSILLKPGKLTEEERHVMEQHTIYAYQMLEPIVFLRPALDIPLYHHEKWDGTGYPYKLKGHQIPLSARIFAVIDVWDALRSDRPYRQAWSEERVTQYIIENSGSHFDPQVVKAFLAVPDQEKLMIRTAATRRAAQQQQQQRAA
jgi:putative nucleotidyltransferase with HDIG domain